MPCGRPGHRGSKPITTTAKASGRSASAPGRAVGGQRGEYPYRHREGGFQANDYGHRQGVASGTSNRIHDETGRPVRAFTVRAEVSDESLQRTMLNYPAHAVNGMEINRTATDPVTHKIVMRPDPSFLVVIPRQEVINSRYRSMAQGDSTSGSQPRNQGSDGSDAASRRHQRTGKSDFAPGASPQVDWGLIAGAASARTMLIATTNAGKVREFRDLLGNSRFAWRDLSSEPRPRLASKKPGVPSPTTPVSRPPLTPGCFPPGRWPTTAVWRSMPWRARPGIHSARWAERAAPAAATRPTTRLLSSSCATCPPKKRTARFVCVLALADPTGRIVLTSRDSVEGRLAGRGARAGVDLGTTRSFSLKPSAVRWHELPAGTPNTRSATAAKRLRHLRQLLDALQPLPVM